MFTGATRPLTYEGLAASTEDVSDRDTRSPGVVPGMCQRSYLDINDNDSVSAAPVVYDWYTAADYGGGQHAGGPR